MPMPMSSTMIQGNNDYDEQPDYTYLVGHLTKSVRKRKADILYTNVVFVSVLGHLLPVVHARNYN